MRTRILPQAPLHPVIRQVLLELFLQPYSRPRPRAREQCQTLHGTEVLRARAELRVRPSAFGGGDAERVEELCGFGGYEGLEEERGYAEGFS